MIISSLLTLFVSGSLAATTFAWFSVRNNELANQAGKVKINSVQYHFYRWSYNITSGQFVVSQDTLSGGDLIESTLTYTAGVTDPVENKPSGLSDDPKLIPTYDPYINQIITGDEYLLKTTLFVNVTVNYTTACRFNLTVDGIKDVAYSPATNHVAFSDYGYARGLQTLTLSGSTDQEKYASLKSAFSAVSDVSFGDNASISFVSLTANDLFGDTAITGQLTSSFSFWFSLDYNKTKINTDFSNVDLFTSRAMDQDFSYAYEIEQVGI